MDHIEEQAPVPPPPPGGPGDDDAPCLRLNHTKPVCILLCVLLLVLMALECEALYTYASRHRSDYVWRLW